jgi:drug/metabolite transporter (DMT)-like permease
MVDDIPPFIAGASRHLAAGAMLYAWARSHGAARPTLAQWKVAAIVGALLLGVGNGLVNWAEQYVPSGLASLMVSSVTIWMVVAEWLRPNGVRPTARTVTGLLLGTIGIIALVLSAGGLGARTSSTASILLGSVALLFASMSWAGGSIYARQRRRHPHGGLATAMEMVAGGAALALASVLTGDAFRLDVHAVSTQSWLALAYLVVFGSLVGFSSYTWLLRVSTPAKVVTYAYVNPVVAVALGWAFAGERLTAGILAAAAVLLFAVALITLPPGVAAAVRRRLAYRSFGNPAR